MPTLAELETALRNADAAGDADAARALASEYTRVKQSAAPERPGALERGVRGFVQGIRDVPDAMNQMVSRGAAALGVPGGDAAVKYWDADIKQRGADYKQNVRGGQDDFDFGRFGGNLAFTAPLSAAMPAGGTALRAAGAGALGGGLTAGLQPVTEGDFLTEKAKQVGTGAATGGIAGGAANMLGRAISPTVSPEVKMLREAGVTPTPGQIMGGAFKSAEEKLGSAPIVGQAIKSGQTRAIDQFNAAAINRALKPVGASLPKGVTGRDALEFTSDTLGKAYDDALSAVGPIKLDKGLSADLTKTYKTLGMLPKEKADQFARMMQMEIGDRAQQGVLAPEAMKAAESNLGQIARGYLRSPDYDQRKLGEAILDAQGALRDAVARQAPPGAADMVKAANSGWANFKRVQRAASSVAAEDGVFSPAQLHSAVKALDPTKDKMGFMKGKALMEDLSSAGKKVLGNNIPNSGTADRLGVLAALNPGTWPYLAAGVPASLMYTGPGQAAMAGLLTGRQGATAGLLGGATQRLGLPAGMALTPALQGLISQ